MPGDEGVNTARFSGHDCTPWEEKQSVRTIIQDKMPFPPSPDLGPAEPILKGTAPVMFNAIVT